MSWFSDLAGKAESLLNNLDEQTGAALRNHNSGRLRHEQTDYSVAVQSETGYKKRPLQRSIKKTVPIPESRYLQKPATNQSYNHQQNTHDQNKQNTHGRASPELKQKQKKSPIRNGPQYNLNNCPKTLVTDVIDKEVPVKCSLKERRFSLPSDVKYFNTDETWLYKLENLEVENEMLKNELNVLNSEISELLDRLNTAEDGNNVDSQDIDEARKKLEITEQLNAKASEEKKNMLSQMEQLKLKLHNIINAEVSLYKDQNKSIKEELDLSTQKYQELESICRKLQDKVNERDSGQTKLENDLRHAHANVADLQTNLDKSTEECRRLEKDWEAYKLRVKKMLHAKDDEIKVLQKGKVPVPDTSNLVEQIESLKKERNMLLEEVETVRSQFEELKVRLQKTESRTTAAESVVSVLRDALRDERVNRNKAEAQWHLVAKELKALQIESNQKILRLETILRDKEEEISRLQDTAAEPTTDTSALNVADYDVGQNSIENKKIQGLTETLVQRQTKIDKLLAQNNILRIQLEKLETKYKTELTSVRMDNSHSVVQLHDSECRYRARSHPSTGTLSALSVRMGVMVKRYPVVRIFVIVYMICLHFWVLTVLFTSTPEDYIVRPSKS